MRRSLRQQLEDLDSSSDVEELPDSDSSSDVEIVADEYNGPEEVVSSEAEQDVESGCTEENWWQRSWHRLFAWSIGIEALQWNCKRYNGNCLTSDVFKKSISFLINGSKKI